MGKQLIDKYNLNLAGEYRVAADLCLRGLYTSVTYGNKKGPICTRLARIVGLR
jgi:hypothetical protein